MSNYGENSRELVFRHLYDHVWAVIEKPRNRWERHIIIMPDGFQPLTGKKYKCQVSRTMSGTYRYNGKDYDLAVATLVDKASILDEIEVLHPYSFLSDKKDEPNNPLASALAGLKDKIAVLPEKHELLELKVVSDRKNGGVMFQPVYADNDPRADGEKTMSFFRVISSKDEEKLYEGQVWRVKVISCHNSRRKNGKGAVYLNVDVELFEKVESWRMKYPMAG